MQQQLVIRDVYTEVQKAFDHNFSLFRIDLKELVLYSTRNLVLFWERTFIK